MKRDLRQPERPIGWDGQRLEEMLREKMRGAYELRVPLKVEVQSGANWYEAH